MLDSIGETYCGWMPMKELGGERDKKERRRIVAAASHPILANQTPRAH
jgi:hypothetical protein